VDSVPKLRHLFERQLPADLKNPATLQEIWRFAFAYAKGKDDAKIIGTLARTRTHAHTHTHTRTPFDDDVMVVMVVVYFIFQT
jgi:hypothetical protein